MQTIREALRPLVARGLKHYGYRLFEAAYLRAAEGVDIGVIPDAGRDVGAEWQAITEVCQAFGITVPARDDNPANALQQVLEQIETEYTRAAIQ